jgi:hypothetical protein
MKQNAGPHPAESAAVQIKRTRNEMMLLDISPILFLTHVGNLTTVKNNQRRFAPTPAHITGIKCPHHRNKHSCERDALVYAYDGARNGRLQGLGVSHLAG